MRLAHIDVMLDGIDTDSTPVIMKCVHQIIGEGWCQHTEIRGVPVTLNKNDMIRIDLTYSLGYAEIQGPQMRIVIGTTENRFIQQIVTPDPGSPT